MAVQYVQRTTQTQPTSRGHPRPLPVDRNCLPSRVRMGHLVTLLSRSSSSLYVDIREGKLPPPDGNDGRPFWKASTVEKVIE